MLTFPSKPNVALTLFASTFALFVVSCGSGATGEPDTAGSGGQAPTGPSSGGATAGIGGTASGGAAGSTGGAPATGGESATGGTDTGSDCPDVVVGFAAVAADGLTTTTGGGSVTPTTVTTLAQLRAAAEDAAPRVIVVSGRIDTTSDGDGYPLAVKSNKTIRGIDKDATIRGGLSVSGGSNVIIQNLNLEGMWGSDGPGDTLSTRSSHHIWFDHLNVWNAEDGLLDITSESSYVTVSNSKFWYTNEAHPHRFASLNGSGAGDHPEDFGKLKVTYHHNWWSNLVKERMPRVVYGQGHHFNNFFDAPGNLYCIGVGSYGSILVENNYFKKVRSPHVFMYDVYMHIEATGNIYDETTGSKDVGLGGSRDVSGQESFNPGAFDPPYAYDLDDAADVPEIVQRCAGPR